MAEVWRDRALRRQAEMESFRKRQQCLADKRVASDRERLLCAFLRVADDMERALKNAGFSRLNPVVAQHPRHPIQNCPDRSDQGSRFNITYIPVLTRKP